MAQTRDRWKLVDGLLALAIAEDIGEADVTCANVLPRGAVARGAFVAREAGVLAGMEVVERLYARLDKGVTVERKVQPGDPFDAGDELAHIQGPAGAVLAGERIALNLLQRMSGIATLTHRYVQAVEGTNARILDTRKTAPGMRTLDKLAVYLGGGDNHRQGLYDMILIKDNHIALSSQSTDLANAAWAVRQAKEQSKVKVEVEVDGLEVLRQVLPEEPDVVLLDNMDPDDLREAVQTTGQLCREWGLRRPLLEASGSITLQNVGEVARTGVDRISVGALTHSVRALDIGLDIEGA